MFRNIFWFFFSVAIIFGIYYFVKDFNFSSVFDPDSNYISGDIVQTGDNLSGDKFLITGMEMVLSGINESGNQYDTLYFENLKNQLDNILELNQTGYNTGSDINSGEVGSGMDNDVVKKQKSNKSSSKSYNSRNGLNENDFRDMKNFFDAVGVE